MDVEYLSPWISRVLLLITVFISEILVCGADSGRYCVYVHEDYYTVNQKYCENGCCKDYGEEDEICCFSWSVGVILGVCLGCVAFIALIVFLIICCYTMKKRGRTGVAISSVSQQPAASTVVYTAAAGYAYPHPPSGFYPSSRFPGAHPPPYTSGTQPAYAPPDTNPSFGAPPPSYGAPPGGPPPDNMYGAQKSADPYGGYGTGINQ